MKDIRLYIQLEFKACSHMYVVPTDKQVEGIFVYVLVHFACLTLHHNYDASI
jgi:hypothetical protein